MLFEYLTQLKRFFTVGTLNVLHKSATIITLNRACCNTLRVYETASVISHTHLASEISQIQSEDVFIVAHMSIFTSVLGILVLSAFLSILLHQLVKRLD